MSGNKVQGGRAGLVLVAGHVLPQVRVRLKVLAAREKRTVQALLAEAIGLLFAARQAKELKS